MVENKPEGNATRDARGSLVTLQRGLAILEVLAAASATRGLDQVTLARRAHCSRSTLYRYLASLEETGYVEQIGRSSRYRLGPRVLYLAATMHQRDFSSLAREPVRALARIIGETAHATVYDHPYSVTVFIEQDSSPIGPRVLLGSRRPLHASASGKVFLAHADPRRVAAYLTSPLEVLTRSTITEPAAIRRILGDVRNSGYALDQGESYDGICGVAAPVFDFAGDVVGALSVTIAAARLEPPRVRRITGPLLDSTTELSRRLGRSDSEL